MEAIITFAIGRLIYTLIDKFSMKFIFLELLLQVVFISSSIFLLELKSVEVRAVAIGVTFIITGIVKYVLFTKSPIEAISKDVVVGIIDFVWIAIMGVALTIVSFALSVSPFIDPPLLKGLKVEYYQNAYETTKFLLDWVINSIPILGATVAACMAILWAGELWLKKGKEAKEKYKGSTIAAIKIVVAYFIVIFAFMFWLGIPLYNKLVNMNELMR